jgi:hypothetical protein
VRELYVLSLIRTRNRIMIRDVILCSLEHVDRLLVVESLHTDIEDGGNRFFPNVGKLLSKN